MSDHAQLVVKHRAGLAPDSVDGCVASAADARHTPGQGHSSHRLPLQCCEWWSLRCSGQPSLWPHLYPVDRPETTRSRYIRREAETTRGDQILLIPKEGSHLDAQIYRAHTALVAGSAIFL